MRSKRFLGNFLVLMATALVIIQCTAQPQVRPSKISQSEESLRKFLQGFVKIPPLPEDHSTRYIDARVDLNDDKKSEVIVYLTGPWCGSGGCTTLILVPEGPTYKVLTKLTAVQLPIRVLAATSNGWHSLGVWVQGGGILSGYEAILVFDGKTYATNPTVPPAQRSNGKAKGKIVIGTELKVLKPLYP